MAFGDNIADLLVNYRFWTGEHLAAPPAKQFGPTMATWQAFNRAQRLVYGIPHDQLGALWGRNEELRLFAMYKLGEKFRVIVRDNANNRPITLPIVPAPDEEAGVVDSYDAGVSALGFTPTPP